MKTQRIHAIDALRGFALAGIVLVHMLENYIAAPSPEGAMAASFQGPIDGILQGFVSFFIQGKFFALFSFLFGLSFFIQMDNGAKRGTNFGGRFLWRLVLLMAIGIGHHLFYRGDILSIYAPLGILLIPFYRLNAKWLIGIGALLMFGLGRYIYFASWGNNPIFLDYPIMPGSPALDTYWDILKNGTLLEVFHTNFYQGLGMKYDFQVGVFGRAYQTFAFFLFGLAAGKMQLFQKFREHHKTIRKTMFWSIGLFVACGAATGGLFYLASGGGEEQVDVMNTWMGMFAFTFIDLTNFCVTVFLTTAFLLLFRKVNWERRLMVFAPYGKLALSNYFLQSVIGTFILFGWGLGLIGELRNLYTFLIALAIIVVQIIYSKWWLKHFNYGPLEWVWRSLTFFKAFPFRRTDKVA